ncbi:Transmembrane protein OS=Castellaniella defragrans OX=75697 GN=HNR28_000833 PE=4 SV=1 [Castellaniella defragrans]
MKMRDLMWILWPSFLAAILGSGLVFALVDPLDVIILGRWQAGRLPVYTLGFLLLWGLGAVSSALTLRLAPRGVVLDEFDEPVE